MGRNDVRISFALFWIDAHGVTHDALVLIFSLSVDARFVGVLGAHVAPLRHFLVKDIVTAFGVVVRRGLDRAERKHVLDGFVGKLDF
mgnify:CR=1 FL=1